MVNSRSKGCWVHTGRTLFCWCVASLVLVMSGCATDYEGELSRLLRELEVEFEGAPVVEEVKPSEPVEPVVEAEPVEPEPEPVPVEVAEKPAVKKPLELTIQPDCLLQISVAEDPSLNATYPVNEIGAVEIGYVGPVILFNKTETEAAEKISGVLTSMDFRVATVKVRIVRASYGKVQVGGAVGAPGLVKVGAGDTISLNDALLRVGGLLPSAWGGKVRVFRDGLKSAVPKARGGEEYSLLTEDGRHHIPNVNLGNNDVAHVVPENVMEEAAGQPIGDKTLLILGEVSRPGLYRFNASEPCTLMHLMFKLSLPPFADARKIRVIRKTTSGAEQELILNGEKVLEEGRPEDDVPLENGDRIIVPARRWSLL